MLVCTAIMFVVIVFTPATGRIDLTGRWHPTGAGGNPFDQDLNTTDSPTFNRLDLNGDLDMNTNDIDNGSCCFADGRNKW